MTSGALSHLRICDFTGLLAGAGATKFLSAFGAQVIRIEDPAAQGRWDILRGGPPYPDERRSINIGGSFNNHNTDKLGVTLNLKTEKGREVFRKLVAISDVVSENFSSGVMERWGFDYEALKAIREDIIYVSNCGFGHSGPYRDYKTFGPIVQATSGLTMSSAIPDQPPAGWGYSYMDHTGAYYMAMAIMLALHYRHRTGEGQYVDVAATEAALPLCGPVLLDYSVNGRPLRREGFPDANHSQHPPMAPHNIYAAKPPWGPIDEAWLAIACRDDADWQAIQGVIDEEWGREERFRDLDGRLAHEAELDGLIEVWSRERDPLESAAAFKAAGVPAEPVRAPQQRIDEDPNTSAWGLWPTVSHTEMGEVRVDGIPLHLSETDWAMERGAPCLGEHNRDVFGEMLGMGEEEIGEMEREGVI